MNYKVGDTVVCIDAMPPPGCVAVPWIRIIERGASYTVACLNHRCVGLVEFPFPYGRFCGRCGATHGSGYRHWESWRASSNSTASSKSRVSHEGWRHPCARLRSCERPFVAERTTADLVFRAGSKYQGLKCLKCGGDVRYASNNHCVTCKGTDAVNWSRDKANRMRDYRARAALAMRLGEAW